MNQANVARTMLLMLGVVSTGCLAAWGADADADPVIEARRVFILVENGGGKAAEVLQRRLQQRSDITLDVVTETEGRAEPPIPEDGDVVIIVGTSKGDRENLPRELWYTLPRLPNSRSLHPEGLAIKTALQPEADSSTARPAAVLIVGSDERGVLYGAGAFLRAVTYLTDSILIPEMDVTDKPAYSLRGGSPTGPGSRAREFGDLRPQTHEELVERMEDLILVGANTIGGDLDLVRSYGMQSYFGRKANELPGGFPKEWGADDGRSTQYVCPSIPEARKALLDAFDAWFREQPDYEIFATKSGDPGGCRCDRCEPWGATYIELVHEIADILHKYHPDTKVIATNQDLSNEGNEAIVNYLNGQDSSWLHAIRYGPGADEMQTYIRGPVNPRWFEYEGFGPLGNYLKNLHHDLPRSTTIVGFTDVTHWMQAQYAVEHPDVALAAVYDRRSWNARPRAFHRAATEILHYMDGDLFYSEGQHDEFNKWFWLRMLWDPRQSAEAVTQNYCRYYFGPDASEEITDAIFLMEETLEKPMIDNPGVVQTVDTLRSAREKIPENLFGNDHRWRVMMQKALMDRWIQLTLQRGRALKEDAGAILANAAQSPEPRPQFEKALTVLQQPLETDEAKALREEALQWGEEANAIAGYREPAPFLADRYDITEVGWWTQTIEDALAQDDANAMQNTARMILHYEDPGEGGYYDNLGWPAQSKHLTHGQTLWGFRPFSGPAKMSHYSVAYSFGARDGGVQLEYDDLDWGSQYVVRVASGVMGEAGAGMKITQQLFADDIPVGMPPKPFTVPVGRVEFFEFPLQPDLARDGRLKIELRPISDTMPITAISEIWLLRADKMPWTAPAQ